MIRVIGLGSPFGDDRAGWQVIERLKGRVPAPVELLALDRPGAALINWMCGVEFLILLDAALSQGDDPPWFKVTKDRLSTVTTRVDTHSLELAETLRLARTLGCLPGRLEIYAIRISENGLLQPDPSLPPTVGRLAEFLSELLGNTAPSQGSHPDLTIETPCENANFLASDQN